MANDKGVSNTQITVALIGAAAVIGSALIATSGRDAKAPDPVPQPAPQPAPQPVNGEANAPPPTPSTPVTRIAGAWRGDDGSVWQFRQNGTRFSSTKTDGAITAYIEGTVEDRAVTLNVDAIQGDSGALTRLSNCEGTLTPDGQQIELSCFSPVANMATRPTWTRL